MFPPPFVSPANPSASPLDPVELGGRPDLVPRLLAAHGQTHGVSSAAVRAHVTKALDVVSHNFPRVILDRHVGQLSRQGCHRLGREGANLCERVDRVLGQDAVGLLRAEGVEGRQGFLL